MRVAIYVRVSTQEQAQHGLSVDTQLNNLRAWAKENGHAIVREYVDAGISGKKPFTKRPELARFVADLDNGLKVDALVFTKLDRFFRSVKLYYQAVDRLDRHGVAWQAIQEDYETLSAAGKFKVNIMLAVAEAEADRTAERVKVALQTKRMRKEAVTGQMPFGYKIDGKKIVKDETKSPAVEAFYRAYLATNSVKDAREAAEAEGYPLSYSVADKLLSLKAYIGEYFGTPGMTPPYLTDEQYNKIQLMRRRIVHRPKDNRVYLFSGLVVCGVCGYRYTATTQKTKYAEYIYYRPQYSNYVLGQCSNNRHFSQKSIESFLLDSIAPEFDKRKPTIKPKKTDNKKQIAQLSQKANRIKDLYVSGLISLDDCKARVAECEAKIAELSNAKTTDTESIQRLLETPWMEMYNTVSEANKAQFWRILLKEIRVYPDRHIEFDFNT